MQSQYRLIHALDVPSVEDAKRRVTLLGDAVHFYKLGLELFMDRDSFELVEWLRSRNKAIFVDLKFFDIPNTVAAAVRSLSKLDVQFTSVHGNDAMLEAAAHAKGSLKILAVTVLSSLDQNDMRDMGFKCDLQELACARAQRAQQLGCDGTICAGSDAALIRKQLAQEQLIVTPGIRLDKKEDDQKRVAGVSEAITNGADYIVVGRAIAESNNPRACALSIQEQIADCLPHHTAQPA